MLRAYRRHEHHDALVAATMVASIAMDASSTRGIKTLKTRTMQLFETPLEFRMGEKYTNNPGKVSGVQFLTHFSHYQRKYDKDAVIDYLHWGKTVGQAHMPHRHQRVAFDFHDTLHPTALPRDVSQPWTEGQDPTDHGVPVSASFDANEKPFNHPQHMNTFFSQFRNPLDGDIRLGRYFKRTSMMETYLKASDTADQVSFGNGDINRDGIANEVDALTEENTQMSYPVDVPGIHRPFLGEQDRQMMQAMAQPLPGTGNALCENKGRYSRSLYLNRPKDNNCLSGNEFRSLAHYIDKLSNGLRTKLLVVTAAQSGATDYFSAGVDLARLARHEATADFHRQKAKEIAAQLGVSGKLSQSKRVQLETDLAAHKEQVLKHATRVDGTLRSANAALWRMFTATKPVMTLANGKCRNVGNGLALMSKYAALRDSTEFSHEGPQFGITPFGGLTHFLARNETTLKYPGLAEFVMLTGFPLYAGDALRLGWTDLFTSLSDMDYHIRAWFDDTEHLHQDAVAWQIGQLLDTCFRPDGGKLPSASVSMPHAHSMERTGVTPRRAQWIEDAFADQPSVEAIVATLKMMEQLPLSDPHNTTDLNLSSRASLPDVATGLQKLYQSRMHFALTPWDSTKPDETLEVRQVSEVFQDYFFEKSQRSRDAAISHHAAKTRKWKAFREKEYAAFQKNKQTAHPRHVFVRLEGCEGTLVDFEFSFNKQAIYDAMPSPKPQSTEELRSLLLSEVKRQALKAMNMPADRSCQLLWCLPNFDTATIRFDAELLEVLHADPGLEDPSRPTKFPPIYFSLVRESYYLSEWAFSVRHQLLLSCPFALKASLQLLREVRGDATAEKQVVSMKDALALEFRFAVKLAKRRDFFAVGTPSNKSADEWEREKTSRANVIQTHRGHVAAPPSPAYEEVFERDVAIDGHKFMLRPRWSPARLEQVSADEIAALSAPLQVDIASGQLASEMDPAVEANSAANIYDTAKHIVGFEVVPRLGEKDETRGTPVVPALASDAKVPTNVNFYEMARHPWNDSPHSWRTDGFTTASEAYFKKKYDEAVKKVYDPEGQGAHMYWPPPASRGGQSAPVDSQAADGAPEPEEAMLTDRFWGAVRRAEQSVEPWAKRAADASKQQKFDYSLDIATSDEKVYDDNYYRWFIRPGEHPNPSGIVRGKSTRPDDK